MGDKDGETGVSGVDVVSTDVSSYRDCGDCSRAQGAQRHSIAINLFVLELLQLRVAKVGRKNEH